MTKHLPRRTPWFCVLIPLAAACSTGNGAEGLRVGEPLAAVRDSTDRPGEARTRPGAPLTWRFHNDRDVPRHPPESLQPGKVAPNIVGKDTEGIEFELEDYRGNIVVLIFSGEWCGPCREEYPYQRQMLERYRDRNVVLLGVNSDMELETVLKAKEREGLHYRTWWDESPFGPINRAWVRSWPTVFILDENGVIRHVDKHKEEMIEAVDGLLNERTRRLDHAAQNEHQDGVALLPPGWDIGSLLQSPDRQRTATG